MADRQKISKWNADVPTGNVAAKGIIALCPKR
jgi:hypothetical protein